MDLFHKKKEIATKAVKIQEIFWMYRKNELNTRSEQNFTMGSYKVGIGRARCSWKACKICSSLVQKKKLKKN